MQGINIQFIILIIKREFYIFTFTTIRAWCVLYTYLVQLYMHGLYCTHIQYNYTCMVCTVHIFSTTVHAWCVLYTYSAQLYMHGVYCTHIQYNCTCMVCTVHIFSTTIQYIHGVYCTHIQYNYTSWCVLYTYSVQLYMHGVYRMLCTLFVAMHFMICTKQ